MFRFLLFIVAIICLYICDANANDSIFSSSVEYLPGFAGPLPFHLETGYVGVDENEDVQLFYYFIESESNPEDDPLMLWITGGPGCSSISGLLYEIGPLEFENVPYNGSLPTLILRSPAWTKVASIIFLDIPVGTGFSYARTPHASHSTDIQECHQAYEFMRKWLKSHPQFLSNPFYVGGDSYSGNPVPIITQVISNGNEAGIEPYINLKGYILGNPLTFPEEDNYEIRFANGMGLISDELFKSLFHSCHGEYRSDYINPNNIGCLQNLKLYEECIDGIEKEHVLEPHCSDQPIKLPSQRQFNEHRSLSATTLYCEIDRRNLAHYWADNADVREALHVQKGSIGDWIRCSSDLNFTKTLDDVRHYHLNLSNKGYRSLIYSGDHDMLVTHQSSQAWIKGLNYSVIDQWRSWKFQGQIAGYTETYSNMMTFATVKGAGHTAPTNKPQECLAMFKRAIGITCVFGRRIENSISRFFVNFVEPVLVSPSACVILLSESLASSSSDQEHVLKSSSAALFPLFNTFPIFFDCASLNPANIMNIENPNSSCQEVQCLR